MAVFISNQSCWGWGGVVVTPLAEPPSYVQAVFSAIFAVWAVIGSTLTPTSKDNCFSDTLILPHWFTTIKINPANSTTPLTLLIPMPLILPLTFLMPSNQKCRLFHKSHQYGNLAAAINIALNRQANIYPEWDPGEPEAGLVSLVGLAQQQLWCQS